jgi:hypothetical protein
VATSFAVNPGSGLNLAAFDVNSDGTLWLPKSMLANASGPIALANPLDVGISDGSNRLGTTAHPVITSDTKLPTAGQQAQAAAVTVTHPSDTTLRVTDSAPGGVPWTGAYITSTSGSPTQMRSGAGRLRYVRFINTHATTTYYVHLVDSASAPVNSSWFVRAILNANGPQTPLDFPGGFVFSAGLWLYVTTAWDTAGSAITNATTTTVEVTYLYS